MERRQSPWLDFLQRQTTKSQRRSPNGLRPSRSRNTKGGERMMTPMTILRMTRMRMTRTTRTTRTTRMARTAMTTRTARTMKKNNQQGRERSCRSPPEREKETPITLRRERKQAHYVWRENRPRSSNNRAENQLLKVTNRTIPMFQQPTRWETLFWT